MKKKLVNLKGMVMILVTVLLLAGTVRASAATVASIGSKNYSSLDAALKAVKNGQTIKLKRNAVYKTNVGPFDSKNQNSPAFEKNFTLDLNRKKLTVKDYSTTVTTGVDLYLKKKTVTIKNGTLVGGVSVNDKGYLKLKNVKLVHGSFNKYVSIGTYGKNSKILLEDCSSSDVCITIHGKNSKAVVKSCTFSSSQRNLFGVGSAGDEKASLRIQSGSYTYTGEMDLLNVQKSGSLTVEGGSFTVKDKSQLSSAQSILVNFGSVVIKGGTFTKPYAGCFHNCSGASLKVCGGSITGHDCGVLVDTGSTFTMTGGSITSTYEYSYTIHLDGKGSVNVTGGTITSKGRSAIIGHSSCISVGGSAKLVVNPGVEEISYTDASTVSL